MHSRRSGPGERSQDGELHVVYEWSGGDLAVGCLVSFCFVNWRRESSISAG